MLQNKGKITAKRFLIPVILLLLCVCFTACAESGIQSAENIRSSCDLSIISLSVIMAVMFCIIVLLLSERIRLLRAASGKAEKLSNCEERWKFFLDGADLVHWEWDILNDKIYMSHDWDKTGFPEDKKVLISIDDLSNQIHSDDRENTRYIMLQHFKGEKPLYENFHRFIGKDGTYRWVLSRGKVTERQPDGTPLRIIGTAINVTELKQIEEEISRSRRMLQLVLDTIPVGVFWKSTDFTYLGCNNYFLKLIGIDSSGMIIGKRDAEIFDEELAMSYNAVDREVLDTGISKLNYEDQIILPAGKIRILRKSKVPLTDNEGKIIGILGTYEDVTVQKNLREETFRIQKLESVGILASGIAHDFNNLLMGISGSLSVLRISDQSEKNMHWIKQAEKSCLAATELTTRLITFSQGGAPVLQQENIADIIKDAVEPGNGVYSIVINYKDESSGASPMIDGRQIRQVMLNLIENAKEAMPDGGFIDIVSSEAVLENDNRFELKPGRYIVITVKDSGHGIPEAIIAKIFDPYFSTKVMGSQRGQGLGLSISHSIIAQHKGKITVSSIPGRGALFTIVIPFRP